jgi:hypothetical protein
VQGPVLGRAVQKPGLAGGADPFSLHGLCGLKPRTRRNRGHTRDLGYTSLQARIRAYAEQRQLPNDSSGGNPRSEGEKRPCPAASPKTGSLLTSSTLSEAPVPLLPFHGGERLDVPVAGIPFAFSDYLALTDWTGRAIRADKRGFIPAEVPPILRRLGIEENAWVETCATTGGVSVEWWARRSGCVG